ncbi:hypothetical protein K440DRAFT_681716 [Wilcoxina mikolae CBS 423.85]|nr:hypothetical protein K440DRAFT_681716 [Wilcoxina mikolae CBS 423.85]
MFFHALNPLPLPVPLPPTPSTAVIHLRTGGRVYLDQRHISPPRFPFLLRARGTSQKPTVSIIPTGSYNLPLDLRTFLFEYSGPDPPSLREFRRLAEVLGEKVRGEGEFDGKRVLETMEEMLTVLKHLEKQRPEELRGNWDVVQEWREDLEVARRGVRRVVRLGMNGEETMRGLRRVRLVRLAFEERGRGGEKTEVVSENVGAVG